MVNFHLYFRAINVQSFKKFVENHSITVAQLRKVPNIVSKIYPPIIRWIHGSALLGIMGCIFFCSSTRKP